MPKEIQYTGTIFKNSNRLTASSETEFAALRDGSYIIFKGQSNYYKVIGKEKVLFVKPVTVDQDKVVMEGGDQYKFCLNDLVTFTHKQHAVSNIENITEKGKNFKVGDNLKLKSGESSINSYDGLEAEPSIEVIKVGENGELEEVKLKSGGLYNVAPDLKSEVYSVSGDGAFLELEISEEEKRALEERVVSEIVHENDTTILSFDHPLPPRFKEGKVSVHKWEILLNVNYSGENLINGLYNVTKDFTPHYNMPQMHIGATTNESAYNESLSVIDAKLKELEEKVNNLS